LAGDGGIVLGGRDELAFLQNPDGAEVVTGHESMEGPLFDFGDKSGEGSRRNTPAPELASDPVADQPPILGDPASDVPTHLPIADDRADDVRGLEAEPASSDLLGDGQCNFFCEMIFILGNVLGPGNEERSKIFPGFLYVLSFHDEEHLSGKERVSGTINAAPQMNQTHPRLLLSWSIAFHHGYPLFKISNADLTM
jgi:hypothetical protein